MSVQCRTQFTYIPKIHIIHIPAHNSHTHTQFTYQHTIHIPTNNSQMPHTIHPTYLPDLSTQPTYPTYLPNLPTWPTTWPTDLTYQPDLPIWLTYQTFLPTKDNLYNSDINLDSFAILDVMFSKNGHTLIFGEPYVVQVWKRMSALMVVLLCVCTFVHTIARKDLLKLKVSLLTWEQCRCPAAWGCPSCARSSCEESTRSPAPPAPPRKGEGSPIQKESVWKEEIDALKQLKERSGAVCLLVVYHFCWISI